MKKLSIIFTFIFLLIPTGVFANQVDFYGEKDESWDISDSNNVEILNNKLNEFYKISGLNTDLIVLGKGDSCYMSNNFDSCIQERGNYSSDLIIALSMKSNIKNYGDIRTLIKDEFKESISPYELKKLQDDITFYFKENNFTSGIGKFLDSLEGFIFSKCNEVGIDKDSCNARNLAKNYHSFVAEKEAEKKYNALIKVIYYIIFIVLVVLSYYLVKSFYKRSLNNLYKDAKYKLGSIQEYNIFDKDKEFIEKELEGLITHIKIKLGDLDKNAFTLRKYYKQLKEEFLGIDSELSKMQESYNKRDELKQKVEELKKIDL